MDVLLKTVLIISLVALGYQDFKERKIYLWLLIIIGSIMTTFHFQNSNTVVFFGNVLLNVSIVLLIYLILLIYSNWKLKKSITQTFGTGDALFFGTLAVGFSTGSFLIIFSFSLIFSLIVFITFKSRFKIKTVPLAGLQSLFIGFIYAFNWLFHFTNLYKF